MLAQDMPTAELYLSHTACVREGTELLPEISLLKSYLMWTSLLPCRRVPAHGS